MKYKHVISGEVIDEEHYEELLDEETESWMDVFYFERWLNENYCASEIYSMDEDDRAELNDLFYDAMREYAEDEMEYEPIEEEEEE